MISYEPGKIWQNISAVLILVLTFYLGYAFAFREKFNLQKDQYQTIASNGFIENSLSKIDTRLIYGILDGQKKSYGELLFKVNGNVTEIRIRLKDLPLQITSKAQNRPIKSLPKNLDLKLAYHTLDGLDFNYQKTGAVITLSTDGKTNSADYSTILELNLLQEASKVKENLARIVLENLEDPNIYQIEDEDLPLNVRTKQSPYFWVEI